MNLNTTPATNFREVAAIMLPPWSDDEIEELMRQPPMNQAPMLPAEELPLDDHITN